MSLKRSHSMMAAIEAPHQAFRAWNLALYWAFREEKVCSVTKYRPWAIYKFAVGLSIPRVGLKLKHSNKPSNLDVEQLSKSSITSWKPFKPSKITNFYWAVTRKNLRSMVWLPKRCLQTFRCHNPCPRTDSQPKCTLRPYSNWKRRHSNNY